MRSTLLILLIAFCAGCRPTDIEPPEVTSFSYRSDGSRRIMPVAVPKVTTKLTATTSSSAFSTTPLHLPEASGLVIGTKQGTVVFFDNNDSAKSETTLRSGDAVYRLAVNKDVIVALHQSGALTALGSDGKIKWQNADSATRADINLSANALLVISDRGIRCVEATTGKEQFHISSSLTPVSVASADAFFYVALSWNATTGSDSVYKISRNGTIESRWGFPGLRITSNIALAGEQKDRLVFGAQGELDANGIRRRTFIVGYDLANMTQVLRQELEYIPTNVSAVNDIALASGFQMAGEEYSGAIDAFLINSNQKMWQRRFTEPLAGPVAVTTEHVFFTVSFISAADIPSNAIFFALELSSGETAREVAVADAKNGFVPGLPIPYKGALLLADAVNNTIYKLTAE